MNPDGPRLWGERKRLARYRYRTPALAGRWRDSREAALHDAVGARQAALDPDAPDGLRWLVRGEIEEECAPAAAAPERRASGG